MNYQMLSTGWPTRASETLMPPTTSCSTTKTRRLEVSLLPATKNCTPNSLATPTRPAQLSTCLAPLRSSTKRAVSLSVVMKKMNCYISFFLPNKDANLDKNDAVSRRAASLFRNPSQYISSPFFEQKKLPANSTDSNKVAPK